MTTHRIDTCLPMLLCLTALCVLVCRQAGGAVEAPALLLGPDPALLEPDAPEDADKPQVAVKVPDIGPYIPEDAAAAADAHASSTPLARQQHQQETDAQKEQQLQAAVSGLKSSVDAYNQLLARPHRMAIRP